MRAESVISEAWRNLLTGTSRAALFAVLFVLTIGTVAALDARSIVGVLQDADAYRSAGASTQILTDETAIDGKRCDALSGTAGVTAAGAIRQSEPVRALAMPASNISTVEATPGVIDMLATIAKPARGDTSAKGVWLSADLADTLGAEPGQTVMTTAGPTTVAGVYTWPDDGRASDLGYAMIVPVPAGGVFSQCWAQIWPPDEDLSALLYVALNSTAPDANPKLGQLNGSLGSTFDASALLAGRLTAIAPWVAGAIGLALGHAAARVRRLEIASALHARVPRAHLTWQHLIETVAWACAGAVIAAALLLWAARLGNPDGSWATWLNSLRAVATGLAAAVLGNLVGVTASREKQLFRYAKDR